MPGKKPASATPRGPAEGRSPRPRDEHHAGRDEAPGDEDAAIHAAPSFAGSGCWAPRRAGSRRRKGRPPARNTSSSEGRRDGRAAARRGPVPAVRRANPPRPRRRGSRRAPSAGGEADVRPVQDVDDVQQDRKGKRRRATLPRDRRPARRDRWASTKRLTSASRSGSPCRSRQPGRERLQVGGAEVHAPLAKRSARAAVKASGVIGSCTPPPRARGPLTPGRVRHSFFPGSSLFSGRPST